MPVSPYNHRKRQGVPSTGFSADGISGATSVDTAQISATALVISGTLPTFIPSSSTSISSSSASSQTTAATSNASSSEVSLGAVIGACVGAFIGLLLLVALVVWCYKRPVKSSDDRAGQDGRGRDSTWNRLDEDTWEGKAPSPPRAPARTSTHESQQEQDEKNFSMFKKSNSVRTARTTGTLSSEDHGMDLPPFEFSKYHPNLAEELALEKPVRPFDRQGSGVSWDGETVRDDSFLSLRSVRVDSGTMSPTVVAAKMTPEATASAALTHKWESAEVIHMDDTDVQNPFADTQVERRKSAANPFFNAQDLPRDRGVRSRSNSRSSHTHNASRATRVSQSVNPFSDAQEVPATPFAPPFVSHVQQPSSSGSSSDHAMKSLIAALELTQEEVEERLRVASMQASTLSRYSVGTGYDTEDVEDDIATVKNFPLPPNP